MGIIFASAREMFVRVGLLSVFLSCSTMRCYNRHYIMAIAVPLDGCVNELKRMAPNTIIASITSNIIKMACWSFFM